MPGWGPPWGQFGESPQQLVVICSGPSLRARFRKSFTQTCFEGLLREPRKSVYLPETRWFNNFRSGKIIYWTWFFGGVFFENVLHLKGWRKNAPKCWKSQMSGSHRFYNGFKPFAHAASMAKTPQMHLRASPTCFGGFSKKLIKNQVAPNNVFTNNINWLICVGGGGSHVEYA